MHVNNTAFCRHYQGSTRCWTMMHSLRSIDLHCVLCVTQNCSKFLWSCMVTCLFISLINVIVVICDQTTINVSCETRCIMYLWRLFIMVSICNAFDERVRWSVYSLTWTVTMRFIVLSSWFIGPLDLSTIVLDLWPTRLLAWPWYFSMQCRPMMHMIQTTDWWCIRCIWHPSRYHDSCYRTLIRVRRDGNQ